MINFFKKLFEKKITKIETQDAITIKVPNRSPYTINRDNPNFNELVEAVKNKDEEKALNIIAASERITAYSEGKVQVKHGQVLYNGEVVGNVVTKRILEFMVRGIDCQYLINFLERVMQNPLQSAREELYLFLENGNLPIMDDGRFQAYKWVRSDFLDCHSGRFRNRPGDILQMDRDQVDPDRRRDCSYGFHVCTQFYMAFGSKLMLVAVDPADVVAVPQDYNNAKMRVCKYEVLEEIDGGDYGKIKEKALVQYAELKDRADAQREKLEAADRLTQEVPSEASEPEEELTIDDEDGQEEDENNIDPLKTEEPPVPPAPKPVSTVSIPKGMDWERFKKDVKGKRNNTVLMSRYKIKNQKKLNELKTLAREENRNV